jgi:hypothetical protein
MHSKSLVTVIIVLGLFSWWVSSQEEADRKEEARKRAIAEQEVARVSTPDPLLNLAGCMANNATDVSKILLAGALHKTTTGVSMSPEEIQQFNEVRDALYQKCSAAYYQLVMNKHGGLTYPSLNHAFIEVLKKDPGVTTYTEIYSTAQKARTSTYVK